MRIGLGFDVHRFQAGRSLRLGGVEIPFHLGLLGHSDADVLIHAICDALLGAAALGDIGNHFPDTDVRWRDVESVELLRLTVGLIARAGYRTSFIDTIIIAERPKVAPFIPLMKTQLAMILEIPENCVSIKATTSEGLGFFGSNEGIAAWASVMVIRNSAGG